MGVEQVYETDAPRNVVLICTYVDIKILVQDRFNVVLSVPHATLHMTDFILRAPPVPRRSTDDTACCRSGFLNIKESPHATET